MPGLAALAVAGFLWLGRDLPRLPLPTPDSDSYLQFSPFRPHGYSWFLAAYRVVSEDWVYLPAVQLGLFASAVFLLAAAITRRTRSVGFGIAALLAVFAGADTTEFRHLMSDPLYAAALTAGIACFVFYAADPRPGLLLLASTGFGIAVTFRAIGLALVPALLIAVLAERIGRGGRPIPALALSLLPIALLACAAASSQLAHNGRFGLGGWGGMSVLGKLPLLSRPVTDDARLGRLNGIIETMEPARRKLERLSPPIDALVTRQYYEYLRWFVITPELEASWAEWHDADNHKRGVLASELAKAYVSEDPFGFIRLAAVDLAGLWAMPRWLGASERSAALAKIDSVGEWPLLSEFSRTEHGEDEYFRIVPNPAVPTKIAVFRTVVVAFWVSSLGLFALIARWPAHTARLLPDLVLIVVAVHAVYVGTALMEGMHERYIMPTWPTLVAAPLLALGLSRRLRAQLAPAGAAG